MSSDFSFFFDQKTKLNKNKNSLELSSGDPPQGPYSN